MFCDFDLPVILLNWDYGFQYEAWIDYLGLGCYAEYQAYFIKFKNMHFLMPWTGRNSCPILYFSITKTRLVPFIGGRCN